MSRDEIDTPVLLIDLDMLERNIKTMSDYYRGKKGAALRPHQKGHRLPLIARKQIDSGAIGVSMTSLGLAEFYVNSGIDDILITSEISNPTKITRLCNLSKHSNLHVGVDDLSNVKQLSDAARRNNTKINVAVEVYMGAWGSAGVPLGRLKLFVEEITKFSGIDLTGIWWHEGQVARANFEQRRKMEFNLLDELSAVISEIEDSGIDVRMLSGGFTPTWNITPEYPKMSNIQVQAGNYVFSDWTSHLIEGLEVFDNALTVLTRCISRPTPTEALFDFGMNSCSDESGEDYSKVVGPQFKQLEGVKTVFEREELAQVIFTQPNSQVRVGDLFELVPPHADTTAKLHDRYYGIREGTVEVVWPNYGRGFL